MKGAALLLALVLPISAAIASPPETSPLPPARPMAADLTAEIAAAVASAMAPGVSLLPPARPDDTGLQTEALARAIAAASATAPPEAALAPAPASRAVLRSPRPETRPRGFARLLRAALRSPRVTSGAGSVCGVREIKGMAVAPVRGPGACGIAKPVKISSVSGVTLNMQPTIDCTTAKALNDWVRGGVIPAVGRRGGGVAGLHIIAAYSCRTRNSRPGAKLSEHSFGHAVDVAGVVLKDGSELTVLDDWKGRNSKVIRAMHAGACGPFGTVLGPGSDHYHTNHFHLDTARYRGGPYCR